jgi:hypothetical protein
MPPACFLLLRHDTDPPLFTLAYCVVFLLVGVGIILWDRRYRRAWQQLRARNWQQVAGKFDHGEIVTMRKAKSRTITGYQAWFGYEYEGDGGESGLYTLPISGEFSTEEEAEESRKLLARRSVMVRVSPRNSKRSCVLDDDVKPLMMGRV